MLIIKKPPKLHNKAIELDPQYARARIGLGSIYVSRAAELVDETLDSGQPIDVQAEDWAAKAVQEYQHAQDLKPSAEDYGNPVMEVASLGVGFAYRLQGVISALQGNPDSALAAFEKAITILEDTRAFFETQLDANPALRRYLVQNYEYLGETYHWQGVVYEASLDYPAAQKAYQLAFDHFQTCIAQATQTNDLIIQDEIVGYCQDYAGEIQTRIETLTGGQ